MWRDVLLFAIGGIPGFGSGVFCCMAHYNHPDQPPPPPLK